MQRSKQSISGMLNLRSQNYNVEFHLGQICQLCRIRPLQTWHGWKRSSPIHAQRRWFSQAGGYSNPHLFPTNTDQQLGTTTGGLGGCTILVSYNQGNIYISHHWEYPGFNKYLPQYPKIMFDEEVMGFLTGQPDNYGEGYPLVAPGFETAA
jgi:hypothetical protein